MKHTQIPMFGEDTNEVTARFDETGRIVIIFDQKLDKHQIRDFQFSPSVYTSQIASVAETRENVPANSTGIAFTVNPKYAASVYNLRDSIADAARQWLSNIPQQMTMF